MKLFCALALSAALTLAAVNPQIKQVNTVYILAMTSGMDQLLANQLTKLSVFQVVTDPQKADAIITDRVGEPFEAKFGELYPPPPPPKPDPKPDAKQPDSKADAKQPDPKPDAKSDEGAKASSADKKQPQDLGGVARVNSFGRSRGTIFIVDRKSRAVIWSTYEQPRDSSPGELSKTAEKVVKRLKDDLTEKKQGE
jgi:hypothetical protein